MKAAWLTKLMKAACCGGMKHDIKRSEMKHDSSNVSGEMWRRDGNKLKRNIERQNAGGISNNVGRRHNGGSRQRRR